MGSAADLKYDTTIQKLAEKIGALIGERNGILVFGAEKDVDSLSTAACRGAKSTGGLTLGVTYGKNKDIWQKDADIIIPSGLERGGGRETVLVLCCDAVIAISGGSGTLTELAIAYQADIPMIAMKGVGGWSETLAGTYLDARQRRLTIAATTAEQAVAIAFEEATKYREAYA
jgi:uncharacterized protein (TIGR00725 family)